MINTISGKAFAEMIFCAYDSLEAQRQQINDLNVFPVPDGDTGTNMSLTLSSAVTALRENTPASMGDAANAAANALLRGARGNSGVILSLLFRGFAKSLRGKAEAGAAECAKAMSDGVEAAYKAVMKPAEGTVLTVSRKAAECAQAAVKSGVEDADDVLAAALETARITLDETMEMNPVLKKAGVIDAGGKGYVVILEAMLRSLRGEYVPAGAADKAGAAEAADPPEREITFTYCTELVVARERDRSPELLRAYLESVGDSLVQVEDEKTIKVHLHTDAPGRVLTEAMRYGALQSVKIENLRLLRQAEAPAEEPEEASETAIAAPEKPVGFVAVCAGAGMRDLFLSLGADRVVTGGQTMNPSTEDILREVNATPAETVFVFPNNKNIIMAAEQCIPLCEKNVRIIPTVTVPQGVSALAYMDPDEDPDSLEASFRETYGRVHTALVTYAARDSDYDGQAIHAGEHLALLDGKLLGSFPEVEPLMAALNTAFEALSPEFLTVYYGADVTAEDAEDARACLQAHFPEADISVVNGGQPVYYYMISAE